MQVYGRGNTEARAFFYYVENRWFSDLSWVLVHCPLSRKLAPAGDIGEIKAARKGIGRHNLHDDASGQMFSQTSIQLSTKVYGTVL